MADYAVSLDQTPQRSLRSKVLRNFCISFGLQRHAFFVLRAISVFYFTSLAQDRDKGQQFHSYFFAVLSLAPVCVGIFVKTLSAQRRAVYLGEMLLVAACGLLAANIDLTFAAVLLIAGIGLFNVSFKTVFGASMKQFDSDLDASFTWLYLAINIGSFLAPLLIAHVLLYNSSRLPGRSAFAWCAGCMALSLYFWWRALRGDNLQTSKPVREDIVVAASRKTDSARVGVLRILVVTLFSIIFWLGFELKSGRLNLDASNPAIMRQSLWGFRFPGVDLQSVNPLVVVLLGLIFAWTWQALARRGVDPHPVLKMSAGLFCMGIGFIVLTVGFYRSNRQPISPFWFICLYVWHSIGELFFEPIGQSFVLANSPDRAQAFLLALWESTAAVAYIGGAMASHFLQDRLYLMLGISAMGASIILVALKPMFTRLSRG